MSLTRFEALAAMNQHDVALAGVALEGIDHKIAMIAVWGVHHGRYEDALMRCEKRGVTLTEAELFELSVKYRREWGIDATRESRPNCFLCNRKLPVHEERLCQCFRAAEVGVFIQNPTLDTVAWHQRQYPRDWENIIVETIGCVRCAVTEEIPMSIVAATLRQNKPWVHLSRKFCQNCYREHNVQRSSSRPPAMPHKIPTRPSNRPPAPRADIQNAQQMVAHTSPPVGES